MREEKDLAVNRLSLLLNMAALERDSLCISRKQVPEAVRILEETGQDVPLFIVADADGPSALVEVERPKRKNVFTP